MSEMQIMDDAKPQAETVEVKGVEKKDAFRTYLLLGSVALSIVLLIYHFYYSKDLRVEITGGQVMGALAIIAVIAYIVRDSRRKEKMPDAYELARKGSEYNYEQHRKILDWSTVEVEPVTSSMALIHYVNDHKTLTYEHGVGFNGISLKDMDHLLKQREDTQVTRSFVSEKRKEEKIRAQLEARGVEVGG